MRFGRTARLLSLALACLGLAALATPKVAKAQAYTPIDAFQQVARMGRGVNVLGYDPLWKDPSRARFHTRHFKRIHDGGFQTIRVNLDAFPHMDAQDRLSPQWFKTLDWIVDEGTKAGLNVIIDEHNFNECGKDLADCRPKLVAFWRQVGEHYRNAPNSVLFELLNEPNGQLDPAHWNELMHQLLAVVRETNPTRTVVIGPAFWNSINELKNLDLPADDRNIIVTVHYYLPMEFTHQGASWNPATYHLSGVHWGTPAEYARIDHDFDGVQAWAKANNRPILLGEFGALDTGDMPSRVRYTSAVARAAEARGWAWTYWQFDSNFIVYDMAKDDWVQPIWRALVPEGAK